MIHLRKFNEEIGDPRAMRITHFTNAVNNLLNNDEYEEGDEPSRVDLLSEIGDLCNDLKMTASDLKTAIDSGKIKNDSDNLVKIVYDETCEGEDQPVRNTHNDLTNMIRDHILNEVYLRDVPYSMEDGAQELDPDSVTDAANAIIAMLKNQGII